MVWSTCVPNFMLVDKSAQFHPKWSLSFSTIRNDESVMKAIIDTVSNALVTKLIGNKSFIDALSQKLMDNGVLDSVKQSVYEANAMDTSRTFATVTAIETKLGDLNSHNNALSDEVDALEQYSRRNCLLLHGVPEPSKDTTLTAAIVWDSHDLTLTVTEASWCHFVIFFFSFWQL